MQVGDLVKKQAESFSHMGLIIKSMKSEYKNEPAYHQVMWNGDYGLFWTREDTLEVISSV